MTARLARPIIQGARRLGWVFDGSDMTVDVARLARSLKSQLRGVIHNLASTSWRGKSARRALAAIDPSPKGQTDGRNGPDQTMNTSLWFILSLLGWRMAIWIA